MSRRPNLPRDGSPARLRWREQSGIEAIEVAMIVGLMTIIIIATIPLAAGGIETAMNAVSAALSNAATGLN